MKKKSIIALIIILLIIPTISSLVNIQDNADTESTNSFEENHDTLSIDLEKPKTSAFQTYYTLHIDNTGKYGNGTWAEIDAAYDWCTLIGSTYVLEDITLTNPSGVGSSLLIGNSSVDLIVQNCTTLGTSAAGIELLNVTNGIISDCEVFGSYNGILLNYIGMDTSTDNLIINNTIYHIGN
jgi:hypothetical protein